MIQTQRLPFSAVVPAEDSTKEEPNVGFDNLFKDHPSDGKESADASPASAMRPSLRKSKTSSWLDKKLAEGAEEEIELTRLQKFVRSGFFSCLTSAMICINGVLIGVETDWGDGSFGWVFVEWYFLIFYTLELILRLGSEGLKVLKTDNWIQFDFFVCTIAYLDVCVMGPLLKNSGEAKEVAMVLRILRLMKLTRIIRLLRFFKELWLLVSSFGSAFKTLLWTFVLLLIVLYVFAILFVKLLGKEVDSEEIKYWFGTMGGAMFTLFQIMTLEEWALITRTVWATDKWYMAGAILIFIMICSFAIMNTVLAVIVEHTLEEAMEQKDDLVRKAQEELHKAAESMLDLFRNADEDHTERLDKQEFVEALSAEGTRRLLQEMDLGEDFGCLDPDELGALFDIIDVDDSNALSPQEFVNGMVQMRGPARARRLFEMHCYVQKKLNKSDLKVQELTNSVAELQEKITGELYWMVSDAVASRVGELEDKVEKGFAHLSQRIEDPSAGPSFTSASKLDGGRESSAGAERAIAALEKKVDKQNEFLQKLSKRLDMFFDTDDASRAATKEVEA